MKASLPSTALRWVFRGGFGVRSTVTMGYHTIELAALRFARYTPHLPEGEFHYPTYAALVPGNVEDWAPVRAQSQDGTPNRMDNAEFFRPVVSSGLLPSSMLTSQEVITWLTREMSILDLKPARFERLFHDPEKLVALGYRLSRVAARVNPLNSARVAAALCMVGLGAWWFWYPEPCKQCYRMSIPGRTRCGLHSQSKVNIDGEQERSQRSQDSRTARAIWRAEQIARGRPPDAPRDVDALRAIDHYEKTISRILWPTPRHARGEWDRRLAFQLQNAPIVKARLFPDIASLPHARQVQVLRELIDPNEWDAGVEIFRHFLAEFFRLIAGADDLNAEIGRYFPRSVRRVTRSLRPFLI